MTTLIFAWYLSLLSINFIWRCEIWGDQVKCSSRRAPRYFTDLWEISFFHLVWSWKSYLILYFVFKTQQVLFFLYLERVYLLWATWVFSHTADHDSFSLLMFPVKGLRELHWYHLQSNMPWSILCMSGGHWYRWWGIIMDLEQILEALQILFPWLLRLGYQWTQTVVFPLGMSRTNHLTAL